MTPGEVLCSASSWVSLSCAVLLPGDGCPALLALPAEQSAPKQSRDWHEAGKCCFYSREVQTYLWAAAHGAVKGGAKSDPCLAWLHWHSFQQGHDPISSISLQLAGPDLLRPEYKQCQEKGALSVVWAHLAAAGLLHRTLLGSSSAQMLLCRQGGSKERINSVQAVVAESELEEIQSNQECCPGVLTTESLPFGRAERRQQSQKGRKEKENQ